MSQNLVEEFFPKSYLGPFKRHLNFFSGLSFLLLLLLSAICSSFLSCFLFSSLSGALKLVDHLLIACKFLPGLRTKVQKVQTHTHTHTHTPECGGLIKLTCEMLYNSAITLKFLALHVAVLFMHDDGDRLIGACKYP